MKPGITMRPVASITVVPWPGFRFGPTATIFVPSTSTSPGAKSPTAGSIDMTYPPRMT